jgi:NADH/F420H2 dehydrogenase subunit C
MTDTARENDHESDAPAVATPEIDDDVAAALCARFEGCVFHRSAGQPVVYAPKALLADIAQWLRDEQRFTMCVDVTAVDHLTGSGRALPPAVVPERFEVVANFLSHARNRRLRVICEVPAAETKVPSLTAVYPGTDFAEREVFDLMGITFDGHPALTRILMPDDWDGHPLRKDFPTARVPVTFKGDPSPR